jgi:hypothetical protein
MLKTVIVTVTDKYGFRRSSAAFTMSGWHRIAHLMQPTAPIERIYDRKASTCRHLTASHRGGSQQFNDSLYIIVDPL